MVRHPRFIAWHRRSLPALLLVFATWLPAMAQGSVVATVDRADVELNESFTLKVTVDTAIDTEPDATALEDDFYVLSRSELSNTMIVNGQISRSRTWSYVLMAKQAGDLVIPPISIGSEQSNSLEITVAPQTAAMPGESDIFVAAEVDYSESYVQAQVLYRVKVYRSVATRQPRLFEPDFTGVDVLVEIAGEERNYESLINGKNYNVVERVYALFPQASGEISISPARFEARVLRDGRITGRKVFQSDSITVNVKPIPPPPEDYPDAAWFPAKSVELSEEWSREPESLPAGEPITRHVTVTALGQLSTQIPVIEATDSDRVKVYPDKPDLRVSAVPEGILASRKDQYAMIGIEAGEVRLPAVELPWWNIDEGAWEVATLPGRSIRIQPSADALPKPEVVAEPQPSAEASAGTLVVHSTFWRRASEILGALWLLTLLLWWLSRRSARPSRPTEPEAPPAYKQQSRLVKQARRAARESDTHAVKAALLDWGRLQWPEYAPRSLADLAARVSEPLASELQTLGRISYGPGRDAWDGAGLDRALRSFSVLSPAEEEDTAQDLPPLMPRSL
ncbi:MAG TPA: BatD family protein [Woeseiaceae bacterium]|nr:BatD family protein [Woeseiaceae bacterium]